MVHVYYHIYAIEGVEPIINEQLSVIEKHFDFPYTLNIGISIAGDNKPTSEILKVLDKTKVRDIRSGGNEFVTLDLIFNDKEKFDDSDYILYIHTKGASKQNDSQYENIISWKHLMNYFNIELNKNVFNIFNKTEYNTYGTLYGQAGPWKIYSGNFWWMKASYAKTINLDGVKRNNRFAAEHSFIQMGKNWKPYSSYNREGENHYEILFKREEYAK